MPRGAFAEVFTRAFRAKIELHCLFLGKGDHYYVQAGHNDVFFPL